MGRKERRMGERIALEERASLREKPRAVEVVEERWRRRHRRLGGVAPHLMRGKIGIVQVKVAVDVVATLRDLLVRLDSSARSEFDTSRVLAKGVLDLDERVGAVRQEVRHLA